jgi:hypothetical protein
MEAANGGLAVDQAYRGGSIERTYTLGAMRAVRNATIDWGTGTGRAAPSVALGGLFQIGLGVKKEILESMHRHSRKSTSATRVFQWLCS